MMFSRSSKYVFQLCTRTVIGRGMCTETSQAPSRPAKSYPVLTGERGVNHVTLIGRLGRDPEVRGSEESPVTIFPLATSQTYKTADGDFKQLTDWHRIVVFRAALGQVVAARMNKGDKVYVSGRINYSRLPDRETNKMITLAQIRADDVVLLMKSANRPDDDDPSPSVPQVDDTEDMHK